MPPLSGRTREYLRRLTQVGRWIRRERRPLRTHPLTSVTTDQRSAAEAVRWLGEIDVGGDRQHALFCHPHSSATFTARARPGDVVTAGCSLLPDAWPKNAGGAEFTVTIAGPATGESARRALVVDPGRRRRDRRWRRLQVQVPVAREARVSITLVTSVPSGARPDFAWAIWGDPAVEGPRPVREITRILAGLVRALLRGPRAALRTLHASALVDQPTADYRRWFRDRAPGAAAIAGMRAESDRWSYRPLISVLTPVYNTDPRWLRACIESVGAQAYTNWELCLADDGSTAADTRAVLGQQTDPRIRIVRMERNAGISAASNAALAMARSDFVALLDHDDELTPDALYHVVQYLNGARDADVLYSDEDKRDADGGLSEPFFKPDWSPEHLLSAMYTCHLTVARRSLVDRAGGFRVGYEGAQDHDLMLRLSELTSRIHHLPRVLYHWRRTPQSTASAGSAKPWADDAGRRALADYVTRNSIDAEVLSGGVPGLYRVKFAISGQPSQTVSKPSVASGFSRTVAVLEPRVTLVVVGEGDEAPGAACVAAIRANTAYSCYEIATAGTDPAIINAVIHGSRGAHIVVLDADVRPSDDQWLSALLEYSQQESIGAVGARIEYADGRLRHIGMITCGPGGPARVLHGYAATTYGHFSSAIGVRNYAVVSGECLMTRRAVFDSVGGFAETLPWSVADVDYCLRVRAAGRRVVFTPYARMLRPAGWLPAGPEAQGAAALRAIWGTALDGDPYYNPNLSRDSADYLLD